MEMKYKTLEIGDQKPFAKGGTGECYRLDEDTILKLYYEGFPKEYVQREKAGARTALVAGVPTAISFQPVQVGNRYGLVYERVEGKTLSELTAQEPSLAQERGGMLAVIAKTLHGAHGKPWSLPRTTEHIRKELPKIDYATESTIRHIQAFMDGLDEEQGFVHGDFHPNNVIVSADGPMLIDMGDFSLGSPLFDLASLLFCLFESPEAKKGGFNPFNGLTREEAKAFWQGFEKAYFAGGMDEGTAQRLKKVTVLGKLRFERLFGTYCSDEYCEEVRKEVCEVFGDGER